MKREQIYMVYAAADREEMRVLKQELQKYDKTVLCLPEEGCGGETPVGRMCKEIKESRRMLVGVSEAFCLDPLCHLALGIAYGQGLPVLGAALSEKTPHSLLDTNTPVCRLYELDDLIELFAEIEPDTKPVRLVHTAQDILQGLHALPNRKKKALRPPKDDLEYYDEIITLLKGEKKA